MSNAISPKRLLARLAESSDEELEVVPQHDTRSDTQGVEASLRMQQVVRLPDGTVIAQTEIGHYPPMTIQGPPYPPFTQYGDQQTPMSMAYGSPVPQGGVYGYNAPAYMTPNPPIFSTPYLGTMCRSRSRIQISPPYCALFVASSTPPTDVISPCALFGPSAEPSQTWPEYGYSSRIVSISSYNESYSHA